MFLKNTLKYQYKTWWIIIAILALNIQNRCCAQDNSAANPLSVVRSGKARFTVLTPGLIRMEWDNTAAFENNATQVVINRNLAKPFFTAKDSAGLLTITTKKMRLVYQNDNQPFNASNLHIYSLNNETCVDWVPGMVDTANLKGTTKTLDNFNGDVAERDFKTKLQLEDGLLSRSGWTLLDDSRSYLLDESKIPWVKERRSYRSSDLYFFCYGYDYKTALYDYSLIAGKVPLPPRYAFGYWWSRYYAYSDDELRTLVGNFEKYQVPIDVLVIDMDWHPSRGAYDKDPRRDLSGSRRGWTGYSWDKRLFPEPRKFLNWTAERGLKVTLNLHPASGIPYTEPIYSVFAKKMNFDTTGNTARKTETDNIFSKWAVFDPVSYKDILYEGTDRNYINNLFDLVLRPLERQGVGFWWLDWQQYRYSKVFKNLDNTWWLNHVFFLKMREQHVARPMIYHRWGGLGNHRYQIGFSGDAVISWKSLSYEPYFTATAANVLYGYWSHDIGGHLKTKDQEEKTDMDTDPELYTRWLQYGVFSPVLRTHSTQGLTMSREPWMFSPKYSTVIENYIRLRYSLAPYIYTMARKTYDTGISLCRPLYYDYPLAQNAYKSRSEYMFGDDMLVSPVGTASKNELTSLSVWLPKGNWISMSTGERFKGDSTITRSYFLDEYPVFVKEGAVIPTYPPLRNLKRNCDTIILKIYGRGSGKSSLYEDAGDDDEYIKGHYTTRNFEYAPSGQDGQRIILYPAKGAFKGVAASKTYRLAFNTVRKPIAVKLNGKLIPYRGAIVKKPSWNYDWSQVSAQVDLPVVKKGAKIKVEIVFQPDTFDLSGLPGKFKRTKRIMEIIRSAVPIDRIPPELFFAGNFITNVKYHPGNERLLLKRFLAVYNDLGRIIEAMKLPDDYKDSVNLLLKD